MFVLGRFSTISGKLTIGVMVPIPIKVISLLQSRKRPFVRWAFLKSTRPSGFILKFQDTDKGIYPWQNKPRRWGFRWSPKVGRQMRTVHQRRHFERKAEPPGPVKEDYVEKDFFRDLHRKFTDQWYLVFITASLLSNRTLIRYWEARES